jgi:hypothetical protein
MSDTNPYEYYWRGETYFQNFNPTRGFIDIRKAINTENKFLINKNFNLLSRNVLQSFYQFSWT